MVWTSIQTNQTVVMQLGGLDSKRLRTQLHMQELHRCQHWGTGKAKPLSAKATAVVVGLGGAAGTSSMMKCSVREPSGSLNGDGCPGVGSIGQPQPRDRGTMKAFKCTAGKEPKAAELQRLIEVVWGY